MQNLKAWLLRLLSVSALAGIMLPWHSKPAIAPAVVKEAVTKIQDRVEAVWPKVDVPAPVVIVPEPPTAAETKPVPQAAPAPIARKVKSRPQRHVLSTPAPVEDDWASRALKAAARRAGQIQ